MPHRKLKTIYDIERLATNFHPTIVLVALILYSISSINTTGTVLTDVELRYVDHRPSSQHVPPL